MALFGGRFACRSHTLPPPACRALLALLVAAALAALFLGGCALSQRSPDRFAEIRESWRPGYSVPHDRLGAMPFYSITTEIDPTGRMYTGSLDLDFTVSATLPLSEIYFRTYPNLQFFGGKLDLTGARVNGTMVNFAPAAGRTAVELVLPEPLKPGSRAHVALEYRGEIVHQSLPGEYTIFGANEDVTSLTNFYPILAARRGEEWALDVPHPQGDVGFADAALYHVQLKYPSDQVLAATGTEITQTVDAGWTTARYALGPAREFTALLSPRFQSIETEALGTRVRSYYTPSNADAGKTALYSAVAALEIYSDQFGPYPYRDMSIVQAPLTFKGMEFPSVSLIGSQVYSLYQKDLVNLVVHEVAHQWWYNQVGSDQVRTPWLDEGLAEFSMYYYYEQLAGEPAAQDLRALRWQLPLDSLRRRNADQPVGRPVWDYTQDYEMVVYGKGALFFAALRDLMGPAKFRELLRTWVREEQWRIATPAQFQALASKIAGQNLDQLFSEWVYPAPVHLLDPRTEPSSHLTP
jgi:hypothetical protein